jgi:hypothetical protein
MNLINPVMSQTLYHISPSLNRNSILATGLELRNQEHSNIPRVARVYFFETLEQAQDYAFWSAFDVKKEMDIWAVSLDDNHVLLPDRHPEMVKNYDAWMSETAIAVNQLSLIGQIAVPANIKSAPPFAQKVQRELHRPEGRGITAYQGKF